MTEAETMLALSGMTGETDDVVLSTYLTLARGKVRAHMYPYGDGTEDIPAQYDTTVLEIAAYLLNKRGAEGETWHTENGVTRYYDTGDVPPYLLRRIVPVAGVL